MPLEVVEKCEICGKEMFPSDPAFIWKDKIVCANCHIRMKHPRSAPWPRRILLSAILVIALSTFAFVLLLYRQNSERTPNTNVASPASIATKSATTETAANRLGKIQGDAFNIRNDGSSDILRGLTVMLLDPNGMTAMQVRTTYTAFKDGAQKITEAELRLAQSGVRTRNSSEDVALLKGVVDDLADINAHPYMADVMTFYTRTGRIRTYAGLSFLPAASIVKFKETATNINGHFSFDSVPQGNYLIYGVIDTKTLLEEWMLPVHVSGDPATIELSSKNANLLVEN